MGNYVLNEFCSCPLRKYSLSCRFPHHTLYGHQLIGCELARPQANRHARPVPPQRNSGNQPARANSAEEQFQENMQRAIRLSEMECQKAQSDGKQTPDNTAGQCSGEIVDHPDEFLCPITRELMVDPVTLSDGHNYERSAITEWFAVGENTDDIVSPLHGDDLENKTLTPNPALRLRIEEYIHYKASLNQADESESVLAINLPEANASLKEVCESAVKPPPNTPTGEYEPTATVELQEANASLKEVCECESHYSQPNTPTDTVEL